MTTLKNPLKGLGMIAALLVLNPGCMSDGSAHGRGEGVDRTTHALLSGDLQSVNGTYGAGCTDRSGAWSLHTGDGGGTLDNPELSVVLNDTTCVLTLTELHTSEGIITAVPSIILTTSYADDPSAFGSPVEFYANAKLSSVDFAADFTLTVLYSDDPSLASADGYANYVVVSSSAPSESVDAPDYALDVSGIEILTDAGDVVQSATGNATLTEGLVTGQWYVVVDATGLTTFAQIDAAYLAATPAALTSSLPASDFTLVGEDLTTSQVRTLIIANTVDGVSGYQAFEISFHAAI